MPSSPVDTSPFFEGKFGGSTINRLNVHTASLSARIRSREYIVWGINTPVGFTLGGSGSPALIINDGPEVTTGTIRPGDRVRVVATSSGTAGQEVLATFSIGTSPTINYRVRTTDPTIIKRVFVTSSTHTGSMGGMTGTNTICATRAGEVSFPSASTYRSLLSSRTVNAFDAIDWRTGRFENTRGDIIANNLDELMSGTILNPILTETGDISFNSVRTFKSTGWGAPVSPASASSGNSCVDYTSTAGNHIGNGVPTLLTNWLTSVGTVACTQLMSLYCYGPN
jgi:hypothetical protein